MNLLRLVFFAVWLGHALVAGGEEFWETAGGPPSNVAAFAWDGDTLYVSANIPYPGWSGLYKSLDQGVSWELVVYSEFGDISSLTIAADGVLYAGTNGGQIRKTMDWGKTWVAANKGLTATYITKLVAGAGGTLYAGTREGVFKSVDKGANWTPITSGWVNKNVSALALGPDGVLYVGIQGGVYKSTDQGASWASASPGPAGTNVYALAITADGALIAGTDHGVFTSADQGATWESRSMGATSGDLRALVLLQDGTLYAGTIDGDIYRSSDQGKTWGAAGSLNVSVSALAEGPDNAVFAGTVYGGVLRSTDKGATWVAVNRGLPIQDVIALVSAPDGTLYGGTERTRLFVSHDRGTNWTQLRKFPENGVHGLALGADGTLYAAGNRGVLQSSDRGLTWTTAVSETNQPDMAGGLVVSPDGMLFARTWNGIYRGDLKNKTWKSPRTGSPESTGGGLALAPDGTLYLVTYSGSVFSSSDQGTTWSRSSGGLTGAEVNALAVARDGTLYAGTNQRGVFRSSDRGVTWVATSSGLDNLKVSSLVIAPDGALYVAIRNGAYRSTDRGATWQALSRGLIEMFSNSYPLTLSPDGTLYGRTIGHGVQRMALLPGNPVGMALRSPATLAENSSIPFQAEAFYDNGFRHGVQPSSWSVDNPAVAQIAADGTLAALAVDTDTPVTVTATYQEGGATLNASRQVVVRNLTAPLKRLNIRSAANAFRKGSSVVMTAFAEYRDGSTNPVAPQWSIVSGTAAISAEGVLSIPDRSTDVAIGVKATYRENGLTHTATLTQPLAAATAKPYALRIVGQPELSGGQEGHYVASLVFEDGTLTEVAPTWLSREPASPIDAAGKLRAANEGKPIALAARYIESGVTFVAPEVKVKTTATTRSPSALKVRITPSTVLNPIGLVFVDWSFENFSPAIRHDLYAWVVTPDNLTIYLNNNGGPFDPPSFDIRRVPYRSNELLLPENRPMLHFQLPQGLKNGVYTFHAVATRAGADPGDAGLWVSHGSATVTLSRCVRGMGACP
ncbi:MAG: hypothetical protein KGZ83_16365 [Sulfuricella sp.]|nr:hypothetical protein [Sulfuricella sp.]